MTRDEHPLSPVLYFSNYNLIQLEALYIVLASEGHADLVEFCLDNAHGWTPLIEMEMVLVASFFGQSQIVDLFLSNSVYRKFCSEHRDRHYQAMLGATAARRLNDLKQLAMESDQSSFDDPIKEHTRADDVSIFEFLGKSLIGSAIHNYITGVHSHLTMIIFLVSKLPYTHADVLYSVEQVMQVVGYSENVGNAIVRFIDLSKFMAEEFNIKPMEHQTMYHELIKLVIKYVTGQSRQFQLPECF
eukprot:scaffold20482_cov23-Cyclotella_meneghiniana.AAC.3